MRASIAIFTIFFLCACKENLYEANTLKERAEEAYRAHDYKQAHVFYKDLVEKHNNKESTVLMNYANLLLLLKDSLTARGVLNKVIKYSGREDIKSKAYQQAALIEFQFNKNKQEAIQLLQQALIADDHNMVARHNMYKILKTQDDSGENQDTDNTQGKGRPRSNGAAEGSNEGATQNEALELSDNNAAATPDGDEIDLKRFDKVNISPERARQLLDAMQKNEVQYVQQLQRKEDVSESKQDNKPSW